MTVTVDKSFIKTALFVFLLSYCSSEVSRKLSAELNPNCGTICEHYDIDPTAYNNIVHVKSESSSDIIHFVWSTVKAPTILIARTDKNVNLTIDWEKLFEFNSSEAVQFTGKVHYAFAAILTTLYQYEDPKKKAEFVFDKDTQVYDFEELNWDNVKSSLTVSSDEVVAKFTTTNDTNTYDILNNGKISLQMKMSGKQMRMADMPHQFFNSNSSLIDIIVDGIPKTSKISRLWLDMVFVSFDSNKKISDISYQVKKTIDDEYTPSVFQTYEIQSSSSKLHGEGGYLQWKPIAYMTSSRLYGKSTASKIANFNTTANYDLIPNSLGKVFFMNKSSTARMANVSIKFGTKGGSDYYSDFKYTSWTLVVGYGTPPAEGLTLAVILIIAIGLGLPMLTLIGGSVYVLVKKLKGTSDDKKLLVNEDE